MPPLPGIVGLFFRYVWLCMKTERCGRNVYIAISAVIKNLSNLRLGSNVSIHDFCYIDAAGVIDIGSNVGIAHGVSILSTNHTWEDRSTPITYNPLKILHVTIGDDIWIGCGARILAGSRIGSRSVIAAGAVVTKRLDPDGLYTGVPATRKKQYRRFRSDQR